MRNIESVYKLTRQVYVNNENKYFLGAANLHNIWLLSTCSCKLYLYVQLIFEYQGKNKRYHI